MISTDMDSTIIPVIECLEDNHGGDYDCFYENAPEDCKDCLCNFKKTGGLVNPSTGEKMNSEIKS